MNASQVIAQALGIEQEVIDEFYTTSELYQWLNDGQLEFCDISEVLRKEFTPITSVAGTSKYAYPSGLLRPLTVYYDGSELSEKDVTWLNKYRAGWRAAAASTPEIVYEPETEFIALYPTPDTSGKEIIVYGVAKPSAVSALSLALSIPEQYHTALVEYLLYRMRLKDKDKEGAAPHYNLFVSFARGKARSNAKLTNRSGRRLSFFPRLNRG